jgi:type II secretory pathway component PulK
MAVLTLLMYAFLGEMQVEYALAGGFGEEKKAEQLAWSAMDVGCAAAANDTLAFHQLTDASWSHDDSQYFEYPLGEGAFTLVHPAYAETGDATRIRWGLEDEASKINLNTAPREILMKLPRMTEEIADSIIDWRDTDSAPGPSGAEDAYYQALSPAYACKNQPFESIEELLYVRGVTPEILYGEDTNLNGMLDANENDGDRNPPADNSDGRLDPGLYAFVTVWSQDSNLGADGQPRVNLNTATPEQLAGAGLEGNEVQAAMQYRLTGGLFPSVAHLLNFMSTRRFREVADRFTVVEGDRIPGQVNVNTAPKPVLLALPGLTEELAAKILDYRTRTDVDLSNIGWLTEAVTKEQLQALGPFITVRSNQFRIHAVGRVGTPYLTTSTTSVVPERPGAFKRMLGVFDRLAQPRARLVYWKDTTRLGLPYDPEDGPNP